MRIICLSPVFWTTQTDYSLSNTEEKYQHSVFPFPVENQGISVSLRTFLLLIYRVNQTRSTADNLKGKLSKVLKQAKDELGIHKLIISQVLLFV